MSWAIAVLLSSVAFADSSRNYDCISVNYTGRVTLKADFNENIEGGLVGVDDVNGDLPIGLVLGNFGIQSVQNATIHFQSVPDSVNGCVANFSFPTEFRNLPRYTAELYVNCPVKRDSVHTKMSCGLRAQ